MRHFAVFTPTKEEVVVLGYNRDRNDAMVVFLPGIPAAESQSLRGVVQSATAQGKDYLMCPYSGSVLKTAHHPSGQDWETYAITQVATRGGGTRPFRLVPISQLDFLDKTQEAFFKGYGASIEPEVDAKRKRSAAVREAAATGMPIQDIDNAIAAIPNPATVPAATVQDTATQQMLESMMATQAAMLQALQGISIHLAQQPAAPVAPARKKPGPKPKNRTAEV